MAQARMTNEALLEVEHTWHIAYHWQPVSGTRPMLFLNGLGETYQAWSELTPKFRERSRLQVDLRGQGKALEHRLAHDGSTEFRISIHTQADDVAKLLEHLKIDEPIDIVAYSYGGGVAFDFASRYPQKVRRIAFIVPFILRLDRSFPMQRLWSWQWQTARNFGLIPQTLGAHVEHAYEKFLTAYMNQRYEHRMQNPRQRQVAIDLTYGIMQFNAFDVLEKLPDHSVFLLTSELDTLVPRSLYTEFWRRLPEEKRGHWTRVDDGEHTLLEQKPELVADWIRTTLA